jgi:hypothetical protein
MASVLVVEDDPTMGALVERVGRVYRLDEIQDAHRAMEDGTAGGKLVVIPR